MILGARVVPDSSPLLFLLKVEMSLGNADCKDLDAASNAADSAGMRSVADNAQDTKSGNSNTTNTPASSGDTNCGPQIRPPQQKTKSPPSLCTLQDCANPVARVIGNCRWCSEKFCLKHRLPEAHSCQNISGCKAEASSGLAKRLLREKCISNKV